MSIYEFTVKDHREQEVPLKEFEGKVLLIVNTASKCGYTRQYEGLQRLYEKYRERGFEVLAFPCNQFGGQEPGENEEIQSFCAVNFGVSFPVFAKIKVNGKEAHPLYQYLKEETGGDRIRWNFNKFLIGRHGDIKGRFDSKVEPEDLEGPIEELL